LCGGKGHIVDDIAKVNDTYEDTKDDVAHPRFSRPEGLLASYCRPPRKSTVVADVLLSQLRMASMANLQLPTELTGCK